MLFTVVTCQTLIFGAASCFMSGSKIPSYEPYPSAIRCHGKSAPWLKFSLGNCLAGEYSTQTLKS